MRQGNSSGNESSEVNKMWEEALIVGLLLVTLYRSLLLAYARWQGRNNGRMQP